MIPINPAVTIKRIPKYHIGDKLKFIDIPAFGPPSIVYRIKVVDICTYDEVLNKRKNGLFIEPPLIISSTYPFDLCYILYYYDVITPEGQHGLLISEFCNRIDTSQTFQYDPQYINEKIEEALNG